MDASQWYDLLRTDRAGYSAARVEHFSNTGARPLITSQRFQRLDLSRLDLSRIDFSRCEFYACDLRNADLSDCLFRLCRLEALVPQLEMHLLSASV